MSQVGSDRPGADATAETTIPMTVEALVRTQLSKALGGGRGVLEGARGSRAGTFSCR